MRRGLGFGLSKISSGGYRNVNPQSSIFRSSRVNDTPEVSVVILTKNAGPNFRSTLSRVYSQRTENEFCARTFVIRPQEFNFGLTRNHGFSLARGEYIVTISQDAVPRDPDWLENLVCPFLLRPEVVAVQGAEAFPADRLVFYWLRRGSFSFTSEVKRWVELYGLGLSFVNCAVRRCFWQSHPIGFTPFAEDKLFQKEIRVSRGEIAVAKSAVCIHANQYTFRSLISRLFGEGVGYGCAGVKYDLQDCLSDILNNKWMLKEGLCALWRGEIKAHEAFFLILRPICILWGNRKSADNLRQMATPKYIPRSRRVSP